MKNNRPSPYRYRSLVFFICLLVFIAAFIYYFTYNDYTSAYWSGVIVAVDFFAFIFLIVVAARMDQKNIESSKPEQEKQKNIGLRVEGTHPQQMNHTPHKDIRTQEPSTIAIPHRDKEISQSEQSPIYSPIPSSRFTGACDQIVAR